MLDIDVASSLSATIVRAYQASKRIVWSQEPHHRWIWHFTPEVVIFQKLFGRLSPMSQTIFYIIIGGSNLSLAFSAVNCQLTVAQRRFCSSFQPAVSCSSFSQSLRLDWYIVGPKHQSLSRPSSYFSLSWNSCSLNIPPASGLAKAFMRKRFLVST